MGAPGSNVCDTAGMKALFERNPDRATVWALIQGIAFAEIGSFIDSLNTALSTRQQQRRRLHKL